jgi:3-oxoacyl-[acyl-carrier-protein] synthase II
MPRDHEIVVTGIGFAIPPGRSAADVWARALAARPTIAPLTRFPTGGGRYAAGEVPTIDLASLLRTPKNEKFMNRGVALAVQAALDAYAESGLQRHVEPERLALYTGSGVTGLEPSDFLGAVEIAEADGPDDRFANLGGRASRMVDRYFSLRTLSNGGLGLLASELQARGPSNNFVQGDTASAQAIAAAYFDLIEDRCDAAVAGGYDSLLTESTLLAYESAGLLSSGPDAFPRPFDRDRDGLVLGEGAAFLVLERAADARRRGAKPIAELCGAGLTQETFASRPKSSPEAMRRATADAVDGTGIDLVVAHGLGTPDSDRAESAILKALGLSRTPITAFKGLTSYLGAATAAVELALAILASSQQTVPPIAGHRQPDPDCDLGLVAREPLPLGSGSPLALCLSWSWAGQCAALAARALPRD